MRIKYPALNPQHLTLPADRRPPTDDQRPTTNVYRGGAKALIRNTFCASASLR
jgi:hypothetical protein